MVSTPAVIIKLTSSNACYDTPPCTPALELELVWERGS